MIGVIATEKLKISNIAKRSYVNMYFVTRKVCSLSWKNTKIYLAIAC